MGKPAQRDGDPNDGGAKINTVLQSTVFCNTELLSVDGSYGTATNCGIGVHAASVWKTANGSSTVKVGGIPVNRDDDIDTCLVHKRTSGSSNVNIG